MSKHDKISVGLSTLLNPVPVVMVSCGDEEGKANILTVAWAGTVNSEPPMVSVSIRKSRYSHPIISRTGEFVINLVNKSLCKACDRCGVVSGADEDKFASCGLTPVKAEGLQYAYAIKESPVSLSCKVEQVLEFESHDMFVARIVAINCDNYLMDDNGKICLDKAKLVAYNHGEYFVLGEKLGFFGYSVASDEVYEKRMGRSRKVRDKYKDLKERPPKNGKKY